MRTYTYTNLDAETMARLFGEHLDRPAKVTLSEQQYNARWALAERDRGDKNGLYYRFISTMIARTRMTREQIEKRLVRLADL